MTQTQPPWISDFLSTLSERTVEPGFRFHCSCGALIETRFHNESCWNCGRSTEVWYLDTTKGEKCFVRIRRRRPQPQRIEPVKPLLKPSRRSRDAKGIFLPVLLGIIWLSCLLMGSVDWDKPNFHEPHAAPHVND